MFKKLSLAVVCLSVLGISTVAQAQATRTWVSGVGSDANPCSRTAPCKTYAGAISQTAPGGTISTLDPGGFGSVTITKSITIDGSEQIAGILTSAGANGILVAAGASDTVILRGLEIHGAGVGNDGVKVNTAGKVLVENCRIQSFTGNGVNITSTTGTLMKVIVRNSDIRANSGKGINVQPTSPATVNLVVDNSQVTVNGTNGIDVAGSGNSASAFNSNISLNGLAGIQVQLAGSTAYVENSTVSFNQTGIMAGVGSAAIVRLGHNSIVGNTLNGINNNGGTTVGFSSNMIVGNGGNNNVSSSVASQ